jgi:hypothetical protein
MMPTPGSGGDGPFAIWGSGRDDVWLVGGSPGNGDESTVFHWDGTSVTQSDVYALGSQAIGGSGPNDVWVVGGGGQIMHHGS